MTPRRTLRRAAGPAAVLAAGVAGAFLPSVPGLLLAAFLLAAPALAVLAVSAGGDALTRVVVAVASSLALNALIAELMLVGGLWSPSLGVLVVTVVTAVLWGAREFARGDTDLRPAEGIRS